MPEAASLQSGIYPDGNLCYRNLPVIGRAIHSGRTGYFNPANGRTNHRRRGVLEWSSVPGQSVRLRQPTWGSTILFFNDYFMIFFYSWGINFIGLHCIKDRWLVMDNDKFGFWFFLSLLYVCMCCIQKLGHRLNWLLVALLPSDTERKHHDSGLRNLSTRKLSTWESAMWV